MLRSDGEMMFQPLKEQKVLLVHRFEPRATLATALCHGGVITCPHQNMGTLQVGVKGLEGQVDDSKL